ncbi:hypothetical protein C8N40_106126 [Pontibacter mucosus]|uniref:Lipoprotein n=1 Tax=Pontibacter mucosus TaxID=1649266 RepID=A0A2T5YG77_9BACT|nr:hypothetical protein [Pontibacter mucosus]PTX18327.1 hypothetical protein C8N40_106126 [Pontibacter mucosus]
MKNNLKLVFLLSLLLMSCEKDKLSKTLNFEGFTIEVPSNWESFTSQGYDSKTGGITNGKDKLTYDYGWYSYDFKNETTATHSRISITIDGKPALIVKPVEKGKGVIGLFIQVDSQNKFSLSGLDIKDEDTVLKIFESVKF